MHDTSVPNLSVWSGPAAPLCCLANKSQARQCSESLQSALEANLNGPGSMIYQTVWKPHTTPLGRQIYRLRASARRTSDSEHSLVPSGWNTLRATDGSNGGPNQAGGALTPDAALSGWRTPMASDTQERKSVGYIERRKNRKFSITTAMEAVWQLSGWPTPTSRDHKDGKECPNVPLNALLGRVAWLTANPQAARITADGTMLTGCSAGMESGGQLNPAFSGWLMGFPEAWCRAAISCQLPPRLRKAPKKPGA